jgi:pyridoxal phosphate enzyme (YggS family)
VPRLREVEARIARAAGRAGRDPASVALVGIAKRKPAAAVAGAVRAGLRRIGESYVQEAARKLPELEALLAATGTAPPRRHFVGRLQRNKARDAVRLFDVIESVDRLDLALELERRAAAASRSLDALLQVDLAGEPRKGGVAPADLPRLLDALAKLERLRVRGLMAIPPASDDPERSRPWFAKLRELRDAVDPGGAGLRELSMGMSADFEIAIEEGATWVRVGTALFGPREAP